MNFQGIKNELNFNGISVLYQISRIIGSAGQLERTLSDVLRVLETQAGMRRGMISILNSNGTIIADVVHGIPEQSKRQGKYRLGEGVTGQVAASGKPVVIPKIRNEPAFLDKTGVRKKLLHTDLAFLCVPVKVGSNVIGVLSVDRVAVEDTITL